MSPLSLKIKLVVKKYGQHFPLPCSSLATLVWTSIQPARQCLLYTQKANMNKTIKMWLLAGSQSYNAVIAFRVTEILVSLGVLTVPGSLPSGELAITIFRGASMQALWGIWNCYKAHHYLIAYLHLFQADISGMRQGLFLLLKAAILLLRWLISGNLTIWPIGELGLVLRNRRSASTRFRFADPITRAPLWKERMPSSMVFC